MLIPLLQKVQEAGRLHQPGADRSRSTSRSGHPARADLRRGHLLRPVPPAARRQATSSGSATARPATSAAPTGITEALEDAARRSATARPPPDRLFTLETVSCLGCCSLAPVIMIDNDDLRQPRAEKEVKKVLQAVPEGRDRRRCSHEDPGRAGDLRHRRRRRGDLPRRCARSSAAGDRRTSSSRRPAASACATASRWSRSATTTAARYQYGGVTAGQGRAAPRRARRRQGKPIEDWLVWTDDGARHARAPSSTRQNRIVLRNCGMIDPESIERLPGGRRLQGAARRSSRQNDPDGADQPRSSSRGCAAAAAPASSPG